MAASSRAEEAKAIRIDLVLRGCTSESSSASLSRRAGSRDNRRGAGGAAVSLGEGDELRPPVALQRVLQMERDDRLLLPILQPKVPGNPTVVLIDATIAFSPIVELATGHAQPSNESPGADLADFRPAPHEIHDLVPHVVRHPDPVQSSPSSFFKAICSAISSARTSSLRWIFFCRNSMRSCSA